ncbi:hypothetical protein GGP73_003144 [Salinibacter ruber]|nr:hypothetical protein [Salinibacter ruber]
MSRLRFLKLVLTPDLPDRRALLRLPNPIRLSFRRDKMEIWFEIEV